MSENPLLIVNGKAARVLRRNEICVGMLGPSPSEL